MAGDGLQQLNLGSCRSTIELHPRLWCFSMRVSNEKARTGLSARPSSRLSSASHFEMLITPHHHVGDGHAGPQIELNFRLDGLGIDMIAEHGLAADAEIYARLLLKLGIFPVLGRVMGLLVAFQGQFWFPCTL